MKEKIEAQNVSSIGIKFHQSIEDDERKIADEEDIIFNTQSFNQIMEASFRISVKQAISIESATREKQRQVSKLVTKTLVKYIHIDTVPEQPNNLTDIRQPRGFLSAERHSKTTPEDLSKRWGISVAQEALTMKSTTHKLVILAIMPLSRRYRADHMFNVKRIQCTIATDTMHGKVNSIHGEYYCQVLGNK